MERLKTTNSLFWKCCGAVPVTGCLRRLSCHCDTSLSGTCGLVDSKNDIDIGCCSPVFNASLMDGSDDRQSNSKQTVCLESEIGFVCADEETDPRTSFQSTLLD